MDEFDQVVELTGLDVRSVSIVWTDDGVELMLVGVSEFEAVGLMRAALANLEADCANLFDLPDEDEDDDE